MASVRVFLSSPYRDMQAERAYLHEVVFPRVAEQYQASGHTLEVVDPRLMATNEEDAEGVETLEWALDEVAACRPHFLCLLGNNYGKVTLEVPDAIGRKHPAVRHFFRTSRVHLETLAAVIREPEQAAHAHFYFRRPQIVTKLFGADKSAYLPNNKMDALNEVEAQKLEIFKEAITRTGRPIFHYSCEWDSASRQLTGFEDLGARVENDLLCIVGLATPAAVEETVPGSMATEEMPVGSMLAGAAVGGAAFAGAAALASGRRRGERDEEIFGGRSDDNGFETMAEDEIASVASVPDAAAAFGDDAAMDQFMADAAEVPDDGEPAAVAGDDETVVSDPNGMDADAAAAILGGYEAVSEAAAEEATEDGAMLNDDAVLNDAAVPDTDAEAAALDIFGGVSTVGHNAAPAEENPFEVDTPAEEEGPADIAGVEEEAAVEEEAVVEEEEEEAPKKKKKGKGKEKEKKGGWFGLGKKKK